MRSWNTTPEAYSLLVSLAVPVGPTPARAEPANARRPKDESELRYWLENMVRYHRFTPAEVSAALVECRRMVAEEASRLRRDAPGFEDAYISLMADQLGITESRRLQGRHVMVREDLNRRFDDTIARTGHWTKYDCVYNIPYGSLLTRGTANLLAAGRCISVDHRVNHATKEIPACMATGQAA
ncbi:MAG: FAD-dependent oxidoreductase, partial [Myxococcales bacterium]|nr:FAD-dependent oxidoreductase [Myxococcales bacterium]